MFEEIKDRKSRLGYVWVQAGDSGNTYLCTASLAGRLRSRTDADLSAIGVDESKNPHND